MLYNLTEAMQNWLDERGLLWLVQVMFQLEFRAFAAAVLGFVLVLVSGPPTIRWLLRQKIGDNPEFYNERLNTINKDKAGVPTMGGLFVMGSVLATIVLLADVVHNRYVHLAIIVLLWLATVGGFDDWLKLTSSRRAPGSREGLFAWEKLLFQLGVGLIAGWFLYQHASSPDALVLNLPFQRTYPPTPTLESMIQPPPLNPSVLVLGGVAFVVVAMLAIAFTSNAVNITDGMDGLAGGTMMIAAFVMMVLTYLAGSERAAYLLMVPHIGEARELMVVSGAMAGACLGFLWFNCSPAQVFMGDTGSLPLGGLLAYISVAIRQEVLLLVIGGIFFMEICSVMLQVGYFKWTKGKRIFRVAPIHHHFHLGGWSEQQVVTRFWVMAVVMAMVALASIKLR
ncbi:MAG: phospho-N-acetylmuramoyl-pentapeptide-transferase [Phycisphaerales bacterium]|nr:phospho-N-acetylmuramoyl-pentapeptide-transferase [Phycisphaerales bacterium]